MKSRWIYRFCGKALLTGAALLFLSRVVVAADPPSPLLPLGTEAPLFDTVDIDGKPYSLAEDLARGPVFLVFWSIF